MQCVILSIDILKFGYVLRKCNDKPKFIKYIELTYYAIKDQYDLIKNI